MAAKYGTGSFPDGDVSHVDQLARSAILQVNATPHQRRVRRIENGANILAAAVLDEHGFDVGDTKDNLTALRISRNDIVDQCIPQVARRIGDDWVNDRLSFAKVTIASARLFALCKSIGREWDSIHPRLSARSLLLATMDREDHIIGPAVLTDQLRRRGHSVQLLSNATARTLCERITSDRFDAVLISVSTWQALESAGQAIKEIREAKPSTMIILGGSALGEDKNKRPVTGADLTTNDLDEALDAIIGEDINLRVAE